MSVAISRNFSEIFFCVVLRDERFEWYLVRVIAFARAVSLRRRLSTDFPLGWFHSRSSLPIRRNKGNQSVFEGNLLELSRHARKSTSRPFTSIIHTSGFFSAMLGSVHRGSNDSTPSAFSMARALA